MNVVQIMIPKVSTACLHESDSVRKGYEIMRHYGYTAIPVLGKKDEYLGSITEGDFLRHFMKVGSISLKEYEHHSISELYRKDFCAPLNIQATDEEIIEAAMRQNFVPIIDDRGYLCGILTRRALLGYLAKKAEAADTRAQDKPE